MASRRAEQLSGEYIHRFVKISKRKLDPQSPASETLIKLNRDHKRRFLLSNLKVLVVEEISLINAELWCVMDLILRQLKDCEDSFGGVFVIANSDCCQLPNISGLNIFVSFSFLFSFDLHFLDNSVRIVDPVSQQLLKLLESRPITEDNIEETISIVSASCNFPMSWTQISDTMIMNVFGKRIAEQEALDEYFEKICANRTPYIISNARDDMCTEGTHHWKKIDSRKVAVFLNRSINESEKIILHPLCVLRATQNCQEFGKDTCEFLNLNL